jgi:hypothetical protein
MIRAGVGGTIELWRLDINVDPLKEQDTAIFPVPDFPQPPITVTREMSFGNGLLHGCPPFDIFLFPLDEFQSFPTLDKPANFS